MTMSISHGIVLGSPRSGTTFLMSVLNTIPDMECISGTLLPAAIPHVVNRYLGDYTTLSRVFDDRDVWVQVLTPPVGSIRCHPSDGFPSLSSARVPWISPLPAGSKLSKWGNGIRTAHALL
jgi:hypothetical protein